MATFKNNHTGVVVSVADEKADRYANGDWAPVGDSPAPEGYEAMTIEQLKDEIRGRNEGRDSDERLPLTGSKAELVAILEADGE